MYLVYPVYFYDLHIYKQNKYIIGPFELFKEEGKVASTKNRVKKTIQMLQKKNPPVVISFNKDKFYNLHIIYTNKTHTHTH
jgi:DNA polymerase elongation subunit (family B)